jgi:hypothetical protein
MTLVAEKNGGNTFPIDAISAIRGPAPGGDQRLAGEAVPSVVF